MTFRNHAMVDINTFAIQNNFITFSTYFLNAFDYMDIVV